MDLGPGHDGRNVVVEDMTYIKLAEVLCVTRSEQFCKRKSLSLIENGLQTPTED
ncbi:hypothetical protein B296_00059211 [Ensete ventricosum]|uniref:Uncharacterized protein n=1 Tax=Ensete ventricosum TaxID=4639 RepID=A0A426XA63_ENSVE|nr:hypothetical protein B296_00059211 [Ensete ventricosum]